MTWKEVCDEARGKLGGKCRACPVCDGRACRDQIPGPGSRGDVAERNYAAWQDVRVNLDVLGPWKPVDMTLTMFGRQFRYPFFAGPVGAVGLHYGDLLDDLQYNALLVRACRDAGICALTGDGTDPRVMEAAAECIRAAGGAGIPTVKPWNAETVAEKMALVRASGAFAAAMDIDAAGLPFLKGLMPPAGGKTVAELREIIREAELPFLIKGIMTARSAEKAADAGAAGIVVSNHGGRVLGGCPGTAEVLPEIVEALRGSGLKIFVDGGIRSGVDVFRALALGADAALLARPFVTAVYGAGSEGVQTLVGRLAGELENTMAMCGAHSLAEISADMIRRP